MRRTRQLLAALVLVAPWALAVTYGGKAAPSEPPPVAKPNPAQSSPHEGVTIDRLSEATLRWLDLPPAADTLALTGVILPPGAAVTAANGTHLFFVEAGTLTIQEYARIISPPTGTPAPVREDAPAGPPVTYGAGVQFLASCVWASPPTITNEGTEPAAALVVSIAVTGGAGITDSLTGSADVYPLAIEDAARVGSPLFPPGLLLAEPLAVALDRRTYERAEADPSLSPPLENAEWRGARLLAVESGALNIRVAVPALYRPADAAPQALAPDARVSLVPGDQLLVLAPGRIAIGNVARGPSEVLLVTVGSVASAATVRG